MKAIIDSRAYSGFQSILKYVWPKVKYDIKLCSNFFAKSDNTSQEMKTTPISAMYINTHKNYLFVTLFLCRIKLK